MKNLKLIAALGINGELGYNNDLIWRFKEDLQYFKQRTTGSYIIMGRKTYESMPKNLKDRKYIVLSRDPKLTSAENLYVFRNVGDVLYFINKNKNDSFYVVGGGEIYRSFLPYVESMDITEIGEEFYGADTYFPEFNKDDWNKSSGKLLEENNIYYSHITYSKKKVIEEGKIIVVEGTDCSGKGTQTDMLIKRLKAEKAKIEKLGFPMYDTPTGKIVGGPYLGKQHISEGYFPEGAANVDPKVSGCYFAADRKYNYHEILELIYAGNDALLDRYVQSNMAHQGGKIFNQHERMNLYKWFEDFEFGLQDLKRPDLTIFLYMPYQYALELKKNRPEPPDQHEMNEIHLLNAEAAYLELADLYGFQTVNCIRDNKIRTREDIHEEVYSLVKKIK